ncbi:MAG TPA: LysR family transcriptional regulator [Solirubrobacteraceae bacterium]|jgi:DNA-binding transcriptional LysR family regulator|nr:LysR family transcriptional regulator [Solirubrobacteraceae bacterium]
MLDLRRLRLLHELHRRGTVGAVAQALDYSSSTVSQQLGVLQREAGTTLFEPAGRRVRLTDAALVLVAHAESLLDGVERAEADLAAAAAGAVRGVVRVGSFQTASVHLLLPAMAALRESHPGVDVQLVESETEPALAALRSHGVDLVIGEEWLGNPRARQPGIERRDLFAEPVRLALSASHPAAARDAVELAELAGASWATGYERAGMASLVHRVCNELGGFDPHVRHRTNELSMLLGLVDGGHAVTLLPDLALRGVPPTVAVRPVAGTDLSRTVFTATRAGAGHRPALAAVLEAVRNAARFADGPAP